VEYGLVRLKHPEDRERVRESIEALLPRDEVLVLTREELEEHEMNFWLTFTPIGVVFGFGMLMGFAVGTVICVQILSSEVSDQLAQYATLRAIGYTRTYLAFTVLQEAMILAVFGFFPGWAISWVVFKSLQYATGLPMDLSLPRVGFILVLTLIMCGISGIGAALSAMQADPAEVF
jgi:putative ABC transport system permease protein